MLIERLYVLANGQTIDYDLSFVIENPEDITPTGFDQIYSRTIAPNEEQTADALSQLEETLGDY